jgi:hypothetical protein
VGGAREFEMGSRAWVLAIALGLVAVHTVSATNYTLGGTDGWTYKDLPQANLHQSSSSIPNDWAFRG